MNISDLSVVLTGASGGIGAATATALVRNGARVLLVARTHAPLATLARALGDGTKPGQVEALAADVTTASGRADIVALAGVRRVNALIQCAGTPYFGSLADADDARIERVLATNLIAPIELARALLPQLIGMPQARILNVGSALGRLGMPGFSIYCASKFGLRGFVYALREDLLGRPIRVTTVDAGLVESEFSLVRYRGDAEAAKAVYAGVDPVTPDEVADCVLFALTRPPHVNIDEIVVKATAQSSGARVVRREE